MSNQTAAPPAELSKLPLAELEVELVTVARDRHTSEHRLLHLLAEYDARNGWVLHAATSCTAWWAEVCGIERSTAREQLRVARALLTLPALDSALSEGRLSYAKARTISRLAGVDTQVMRSSAPAGASLAQSRADAILQLLVEGGSVGAEVLVHVARSGEGQLVAALGDGTPVPEPQLSRILCESSVRALIHDSDGRPIDASPARPAPTKRQLRLLHERDRHCRYPGCTARQFLDAHHVVHREHGGATVVDNLLLLCSFHHRLVHEMGWPE